MTSIFPSNLPGYCYLHDPTKVDYKKSSYIYQNKKKFGELNETPSYLLPNETTNIEKDYEPSWVKYDKQVLRYYAYFKESVVEEELESGRIRLLIIYYYLVDDTISINDVKQENSGIPQGSFLKKGKVQKLDGSYYSFRDFQIGKDINIYGKIVRIYDADEYTRNFCSLNGITLNAKQPIPEDPFLQKLNSKPILAKDHLMKDYLEYSMGGGKVKNAKQFLENDRKVLRYYAKLDDIKYIIHYYLSDDTVEIREVNYNNSGRDPFRATSRL